MVPPSQVLIKSQSDQKMPLIFPLCIANSWPHTKFRWPMSPRSESRANSTLCSKSKSYFNENSGLVHYLLYTELYSKIYAENPINIERAVVWLPFLETTIFFEWLCHYIKSRSFWTIFFCIFWCLNFEASPLLSWVNFDLYYTHIRSFHYLRPDWLW